MSELEIHYDPNGDWDDAFLLGRDGRDGCASTLDEVRAYGNQRQYNKSLAQELRNQAAEKLAQAEELEKR
jgi:hypothetical protein